MGSGSGAGPGRGVRAQHDRHPRSRRLHVRGLPVAGRVRGGHPPRRRRAGHRGPDAGQPLPRAGERPPHHPRPQQDRPPRGRPREVREGAGLSHRGQAGGRAACLREDRHGGRGSPRPDRRGDPGSGGRRGRTRAGHDLRFRVRRLPRRGHLRADGRRQPLAPGAHPDDVHRCEPRGPRGRRVEPGAHPDQGPRRRRGGLPHHRREGRAAVEGRRHDHERAQARGGGASRLHGPQADGVLGHLPDRRQRLRRTARGARQAQALRRLAAVRAGDLGRPRLRIPLRLPRSAAPGDRDRAPFAGVRPRPHHHRPERDLRGRHERHRRDGDRDEPERVPRRPYRLGVRADGQGGDPAAEGLRRHRHGAVPVAARHAARHGVLLGGARRAALQHAARRDRVRLLRPAQVQDAGLRLARLRAFGAAGGRPRQGRHPPAGREGRCVQLDRAPRQGLRLRHDDGGAAAQAHPSPAVRGADPSRDRCAHHRPGDDPRDPQGRARQVLRR